MSHEEQQTKKIENADEFEKVCGFLRRLRTPETQASILNSKGLVYFYAILRVLEQDRFAIESTESKNSFPANVASFIKKWVPISDADAYWEKEERHIRKMFDLRPDLYSINLQDGIITIHEIEDTSRLTPYKLEKIVEAYCIADQYEFRLRLFVYDRYGLMQREINILELYLMVPVRI